jgi:hypothetical protein
VAQSVTIASPAAGWMALSGAAFGPAINISPNGSAALSGLAVTQSYRGIRNDGYLTVHEMVIHNNYSEGIQSTGNLNVERSTIRNNGANGSTVGGGIWIVGYAALTIRDSTINNNNAQTGGGIYADPYAFSLVNSTVSSNSATTGGGIYLTGYGANYSVEQSTIAFNNATTGGGIFIDDTVNYMIVRNSIVADNTATYDDNISGVLTYGLSMSVNNLIGFDGRGGITTSGNNIILGASETAGLTALRDVFGSQTKVHALKHGSKALDNGSNTVATSLGLTKDQRGEKRIVDGPDADTLDEVDIGAFELAADEFFGSL